MAMAADLIGMGTSPLLAQRTASGGNGPLTITATAATTIPAITSASAIDGSQYVVSVLSGGLTSGGVILPPIGGDNGALLADQFVINNIGTANIQVWAQGAGVTISANSTNRATQVVPIHTSIIIRPVTSTLWIGTAGS